MQQHQIIAIDDDENFQKLYPLMINRFTTNNLTGRIFPNVETILTMPQEERAQLFQNTPVILIDDEIVGHMHGPDVYQALRDIGYTGPIGGISTIKQSYVDFYIGKPLVPNKLMLLSDIIQGAESNEHMIHLLHEKFPGGRNGEAGDEARPSYR